MTAKFKTSEKTKHGLPILSSEDDLLALFDENSPSEETVSHTEHTHQHKKPPQNTISAEKMPVSESARPSQASLTSHKFPGNAQHAPVVSDDDDDNFADMFEASLSEIKIRDILAEKHGDVIEQRPTTREIVKTRPAPQMQIDLHGCNRKEAEQKADSFIYSARYKGLKTVRIIVGKGIHSRGEAVLPDVIEKNIIALKKKQVVLSYCWEKRKKRKSGAVIVYLA